MPTDLSRLALAALMAGFLFDGYVPDRDCAICHRAIWQSYQDVGMAKSFSRPRTETIIEDFVENNHFYHEPSRRHYELTHRDGRFFMRRYQTDATGKTVNEVEQEIDWIIGSGLHSRGYLYQTEAGELFELPIAWYTQEGRFGMAPGYDRPDHDGVTRQITRECMFCHNAYPDVPAGSDVFGAPQIFPAELPEGTGCQRCHGPGAEHIEVANDLGAPMEAVLASIVNPGRLPPGRRDDVCFQCHLQPTSKLTSFVRRFDQPAYAFRPGDALGEFLVHLDFDEQLPRSERFEINHHPYRLRQSRCYQGSDELSCMTCHDPHRKVAADQAAGHYRDRCLTCHQLEDCLVPEMDDDCVACHMPKRRTQDVIHVVMTDHLIQRTPPADALAPLAETPPAQGAAVELYWPNRPPPPTGDVYKALSAVADGNLSALPALAQTIDATDPSSIEPRIELGTGHLRAQRFEDARSIFESVRRREPKSAITLANLGVALSGLGDDEQAIAPLERARDLAPVAADTHYNLGAAYARVDRADDARAAYQEAVRLRPNYAGAWLNLGNLEGRAGRLDVAAAAFREALAIEPNLAAAYVSLAVTHRHRNDWHALVGLLRHGFELRPDASGIARELALAYLVSPDAAVRDPEGGLLVAEAAVTQAPKSPIVQTVYSLALVSTGQPREAIRAANRAWALRADETTCMRIVAIAQHQLGHPDEARRVWAMAAGHHPPEGGAYRRIYDALSLPEPPGEDTPAGQ